VLLVTSAQASEGKTTTSYAVARGFARVGKRVLLIDADLRRPSMHKLLGADNAKGLSRCWSASRACTSRWSPAISTACTCCLRGRSRRAQAELLSSPRMAALLEQLEHTYDLW
jgi:Mrp family chromosome partitioning ATPase